MSHSLRRLAIYLAGGGAQPLQAPVIEDVNRSDYEFRIKINPVEGATKYYAYITPYASAGDGIQIDSHDFRFTSEFNGVIECDTIGSPFLLFDYNTMQGEQFAVSVIACNNDGIYSPRSNVLHKWVLCFLSDTNILLSNRKNKLAKEITYNDELLVWNFDERKFDVAKPLWIQELRKTQYYYQTELDDGTIFNATGNRGHRIFSVEDNKFIYNTEMVGKHTIKYNNSIHEVVSCKLFKEEKEYTNIITDKHINVYCNGILTSSSLNNLYPIEDMKFVKPEKLDLNDIELFDEINNDYINGMRLLENKNKSIKDLIKYANNCYLSKK